ncbi:ABC transporter permease [Paractinoplanes lichenicola]|uniref:ABC transporter permease n=1 Tax=Paractinoplanes lichenicola TaxID=2802976 RepID=A0ABS1VYG9_9ACTN|nr:ABC transporter permease [Actinoplanes lichenicola]MBL7259538.1 ABC transporter permease [Actinoplanes lichenicola]
MRRRWLGLASLLVVVTVAAHFLLPGPLAVDYSAILAPPSLGHPLGTDQLGRDAAARLLAGARLTLGLTVATLLVTALFGTAVGMLSGYAGGPLGRVVPRIADMLAALPTILVGLFVAAALGPGLLSIVAAVCLVGWTPFARQAYHLTVRESARDYVGAARTLGAGPLRLLIRHITPNIAGPLLAHLFLRFAGTLLTVSGLSFLGLGVQPPAPEWGSMVAEGRAYLFGAPHLVLAPAAAVILTATLTTLVGRRLDPDRGSP